MFLVPVLHQHAFLVRSKGKMEVCVWGWGVGGWSGTGGFDMLLCNECNFIFVTVCVSAVWSPSVTPIKHPVNYCELRRMRERQSLHFPLF